MHLQRPPQADNQPWLDDLKLTVQIRLAVRDLVGARRAVVGRVTGFTTLVTKISCLAMPAMARLRSRTRPLPPVKGICDSMHRLQRLCPTITTGDRTEP